MKGILFTIILSAIVSAAFAQWSTLGTSLYYNSGNVGIGTTSPGVPLDVKGVIRSTTGGFQIGKFGIAANPMLSVGLDRSDFANSAIINGWGNSSNPGISVGTTRNDGTAFSVVTGVTLDANYLPSTVGTTAFTVLGMGNVGVGTTTPQSLLHVYQSAADATGLIIQGHTINTDAAMHYVAMTFDGDYGNATGNYSQIRSYSNLYDSWGSHLAFFTTQAGVANTLKERMRIDWNGNVGIGTVTPGSYKLAVNGGIHSQSVNVDLTGWSDYVFNHDYILPSLTEIKTYIDQNHHLPDMPSEQQVIKDGINLGEMNRLLTKKVEELTLYLIDKDSKINSLEKTVCNQQQQIDELQKQLDNVLKVIKSKN